jgi:filamentous hemagglutinin
VVGGIRPSYLISQLPSNLQPGSVPFYYNPFDENQALQTAALQRLGKASFIDGLAYDNTYQTTVVDQEKYALYANALDYAKAHDLKLGVALSAEQLASLDKPMLWYVEQAVPQPGCTATGGAVCPTVDALMPQVYLPQGYNAVNPDGVINGHDVTLAFHDANRRTTLRTLGRSRRPARCRRRVHASRTSSVRSTSVRTTRKPVTTDTRARRAPSCSKAVS